MKRADTPLDGESSLYDAVKDLTPEQVAATVKKNAPAVGLAITGQHLEVINTLITHYQQSKETVDRLGATKNTHWLKEQYADQGGSKYLYDLFDQVNQSGEHIEPEDGILTKIHRLAGLPGLLNNRQPGHGVVL